MDDDEDFAAGPPNSEFAPPPPMSSDLAESAFGAAPAGDAEPEPEMESAADEGPEDPLAGASAEKVGLTLRIQELEAMLEGAVESRDFAAAWRLQREIEQTCLLVAKVEEFDARLAQTEAEMHLAAQDQRFYEAGYLMEEQDHLLRHKMEVIDIETRIAALHIAALSHAQNPDSLERAVSTKKDVETLEAAKRWLVEQDAKKADLRKQMSEAVAEKRYRDADRLKEQLQQVAEEVEPEPEGQAAAAEGAVAGAVQGRPAQPLAAPRTTPPTDQLLLSSGMQPNPPPSARHDVVANLASLIWESSQPTPSPAPAARVPPVDAQYKRRLLNFYQKYNPSKLPSVTTALAEYRGNEEKLFEALRAKYGPEPPDMMSLPLPPGWRLVESQSGDVFYIHTTGKKQWDRPPFS